LGVGLNRLSAGFTADDNDVFEEWEQDVNDFLAQFPGNYELKSDNATRTIDAAGTVILPAARASLSIGYRF
jgi:antibiotic biosynthesis monooxygenase (ABM) superfamily enzyme